MNNIPQSIPFKNKFLNISSDIYCENKLLKFHKKIDKKNYLQQKSNNNYFEIMKEKEIIFLLNKVMKNNRKKEEKMNENPCNLYNGIICLENEEEEIEKDEKGYKKGGECADNYGEEEDKKVEKNEDINCIKNYEEEVEKDKNGFKKKSNEESIDSNFGKNYIE